MNKQWRVNRWQIKRLDFETKSNHRFQYCIFHFHKWLITNRIYFLDLKIRVNFDSVQPTKGILYELLLVSSSLTMYGKDEDVNAELDIAWNWNSFSSVRTMKLLLWNFCPFLDLSCLRIHGSWFNKLFVKYKNARMIKAYCNTE